jgi:hypothetical protein
MLLTLDMTDRTELYRFLALRLGRRPKRGLQLAQLQKARGAPKFTYREEYVRCGKRGCVCAKGKLHGPYTYKYWREKGKLRKEYIRKSRPPAAAATPPS